MNTRATKLVPQPKGVTVEFWIVFGALMIVALGVLRWLRNRHRQSVAKGLRPGSADQNGTVYTIAGLLLVFISLLFLALWAFDAFR